MHDREAIAARLVAAVPMLDKRIGTALQLAQAMKSGTLGAQSELSAYLLPVGMRGGAADAAAGLFRQALDRLLGVVLVVRAISDPLGARVVDALETTIEAVMRAIAGWAPGSAIGVYRFARGELVSLDGGVATYQLDFILDDQLRIAA
ncbi:MAG: hypothetical protein V4808_07210 [Pseudomonadota bacterium]